MSQPRADHPHEDPGDGRTECQTCGKWVFPVTHSCKGVRVVDDPPMFVVVRFCADGDSRRGPEVEYVRPTQTLAHAHDQLGLLRECATRGGRHCCRYEVFELHRAEPTAPNPDCNGPDDSVYVAAATASVRTEGVNDGYIASTARDEPFRAAVDVAYAAGRHGSSFAFALAARGLVAITANACCGGNGLEASCEVCRD